MRRFDDVDHDGFDLDDDLPDRTLFHAIETRLIVGDLGADEPFGLLAERYPDDARLRLCALAADVDANGVRDALRGPEWVATALESIAPALTDTDRPALAAVVTLLFDELRPEDEAIRARVRPLVESWPRNAGEARHALRTFFGRVLDEAEERTRGNRPWAEPKKETPIELAARSTGPARRYAPTETFARGDRVLHPKFGEGVVLGAAEGKIDVAFGNERKTLVAKV